MKQLLTPLFLLCCVSAFAQKKAASDTRFAGLEAQLEGLRKDFHAAGFAVAVVDKNGIVWSKGIGYRDVENKLPATPNTVYAIGSCTKAFTSALIGLLQTEGKVDLDKPANLYLPSLRFYNDAMYDRISLRDMMSHRTGLPRHDFSWYLFSSGSTDSLLQRVVYMEPTAGVRDRWQYNNFMFAAQGAIAEKLTGKSWAQAIREKFFVPLGMTQSNTTVPEWEKTAEPAAGYGLKKDSILHKLDYYNISGMAAAGAINSSVTEMAPWVVSWINGGRYKGKEILPASYVSAAISSQAIIGAGLPSKEKPDVMFANYGFGWFLASYRGHYRVEHGGNIDGFSASTSFFPTDSLGIIVLTNQDRSQLPGIVRNIIADRILGLKPFDWRADGLKARKEAMEAQKLASSSAAKPKPNTKPSHSLDAYEGTYSHPAYGNMSVFRRGDSLFVQAGAGNLLWLKHRHYDVFDPYTVDKKTGEVDSVTELQTIKFQFLTNVSGDIDAFTVPFEAELKPFVFTRQLKEMTVAAADLKKYEGDYTLSGMTVKIYTRDNKLFALVPGQPDYELVAVEKDKFGLKALSGYFVQFTVEGDKARDLTFMQPNGNFKAMRK